MSVTIIIVKHIQNRFWMLYSYEAALCILKPTRCFSKSKQMLFSGYFDPTNIFFDNKTIIFWGDLTDILDETV